jgi:hypothetical protein
MIEWLLLTIFVFLSAVDIIWKKFPSGFMTGLLFMTVVSSYTVRGDVSVILGLFGFIVGWMMLEFGVPIKGVADLKIITMISCVLLDLRFLFLFITIIMVYGFIYQTVMLKLLKYDDESEIAFIPVLTACYITLIILGGII